MWEEDGGGGLRSEVRAPAVLGRGPALPVPASDHQSHRGHRIQKEREGRGDCFGLGRSSIRREEARGENRRNVEN